MVRALSVALLSAVLCAGCGRATRSEKAPAPPEETAAAKGAAASVPAVNPAPPAPVRVVLVYAGELQGYLTPCGCAEGMLGGLPRRAKFLAKLRQEAGGALVNVDLGNLVKEPSRQSELKFLTILEACLLLGYDAVCLGERDLSLGGAFLGGELMNRRQLPIVVANLKVAELDEIIQPFRSTDVKGVSVFIASLLDPELVSGMVGVTCEEPLAAGKALAGEAARHDLKVLIAHAALEKAKSWAGELGFFDVVVTGVGHEDPTTPEKVGAALVVAPGVWGKYGCGLRLSRGADGAWAHEFIKEPIVKELGNDPDVLQLIKDYQGALAVEEKRIAPERTPHPRGLYTGSKRCAECHAKAYQVFEKSRHAEALKTLEEVKSHVDPECLPCHTVGYYFNGGFKTAEETPEFGAVGCECCHGPGARHVEENDAKSIERSGEKECLECHTELRSPGFSYKEYFRRIAHPEK